MNGWLRRLFHKRLAERRLDEELRFHLEQRVKDYVASGLPPAEARRRANLRFGGLDRSRKFAAKRVLRRLTPLGMLIGVLASLGLTCFLASQISGVSATDPLTFCTVVVVFLAVGHAACLLPARRAARLDPLIAPRYE